MPTCPAPLWHLDILNLKDIDYVIKVDDDPIVKESWTLNLSRTWFQGELIKFSQPESFKKWLTAYPEKLKKSLVLMDYHFANSPSNGLQVIESCKIEGHSVLISGFSENEEVLTQCKRSNIRFLPKQKMSEVEISV